MRKVLGVVACLCGVTLFPGRGHSLVQAFIEVEKCLKIDGVQSEFCKDLGLFLDRLKKKCGELQAVKSGDSNPSGSYLLADTEFLAKKWVGVFDLLGGVQKHLAKKDGGLSGEEARQLFEQLEKITDNGFFSVSRSVIREISKNNVAEVDGLENLLQEISEFLLKARDLVGCRIMEQEVFSNTDKSKGDFCYRASQLLKGMGRHFTRSELPEDSVSDGAGKQSAAEKASLRFWKLGVYYGSHYAHFEADDEADVVVSEVRDALASCVNEEKDVKGYITTGLNE